MKTLQSQDYWDIALSIFLIIVSIVTLVGISNVRDFQYEPLGPKFIPKALAYCFIVMSGMILVKVFMRVRKGIGQVAQEAQIDVDEKQDTLPKQHPWLGVLAAAMISLFIASINFLGFRITSLIFMVVLGAILIKVENKSNKKRNLISLILLALLLSFGLYFIFRELLGVRVP